jgi:transcriptional regulator with XRE-family HTH domain
MDIIQTNLHPKVLKNQLFIRAVDYLIDEGKVASQKELAQVTGITEATLSNIRNDKKIVSDKTIRKLLEAFPGLFNADYFRGKSIYMLMSDYLEDKIEAEEKEKEVSASLSTPVTGIPDMSSVLNSALAKADESIASLKIALATKEQLIAEKQARIVALEQTVADKDSIIRARDARILELERRIANINASDLSRYPFAIGAAEEQNNPNVSPYQTETSRKHQ